jgi:putative DNA primase/helicase
MLNYALAYAARGWAVLPVYGMSAGRCTCRLAECRSPGKHPRIGKWSEKASKDPAIIRDWWRRWPDSAVGIVTGPMSSLAVLDVDRDRGGFESLRALENVHGNLPETLSQATGGGGRHYLFEYPEGTLRSSAGALGSGLDIRAAGGFIVAAPSPHVSGGTYAWDCDFQSAKLATLPGWITDRLQTATSRQRAEIESGDVREGNRNSYLTSLGGKLRRSGESRQNIQMHLAEVNADKCNPPLDPNEVRRIADSVSRYRKGPAPNNVVHLFRDWLKSPEGPSDPMAVHILRTLTDYMGSQGRKCFPNVEDIAAAAKCNEKTVRRHLQRADNSGWIKRLPLSRGGGRISYAYSFPEEMIHRLRKWTEALDTES